MIRLFLEIFKTALIGLLNEIIDIPEEEYSHIEIIESNLRIDKLDSKSGILDIKLTTKSGQKMVQFCSEAFYLDVA